MSIYKYREISKELPVIAEMDVVVIGGGASGMAAAVTAARKGLKTMIIERYGFFGGATVAGLSGTIGGLYSSSKSNKIEQIVHGFAGEFATLLKKNNGLADPFPFGNTALCVHDPLVWKETADLLVKESGVHVLLHTLFVDVIKDDGCVKGIIIENKDGRSAIMGKVFIDGSGDGDLAVKAGADYTFGNNGNIQSPTMVFRMEGINWNRAKEISMQEIGEKIDKAINTGDYFLPRRHIFLLPGGRKGQGLINATRIVHPKKDNLYATNTEDLTYSEFEGRRQIREYERFLKNYVPGFENAYVSESATQVGIRQSRTIQGEFVLKNEDVINARKFETGIVRSAWPIEAHGAGKDGVKIFNLNDDYYEIPFEVMLPKKVDQVLVVGRCMSAEHEALASARVTAQCFEEGFSAAIASYLAIANHVAVKEVDPLEVREIMKREGSNL